MVLSSSEGLLIDVGASSLPATALSHDPGPAPALRSTEPLAESESDPELHQLESLLAVRARELSQARAELARLQGLLRDAIAHFENTLVDGAAVADSGELARQRDLAVARALEAEAGRAELRYRLDELMGHLAVPGDGGKPGESLEVTCARLAGTVRGLRSALADVEEARDVADARRLLIEHDLEHAEAREHVLQRELGEAREHAELELVRAGGLAQRLELTASARESAEHELAHVRTRLAELERAAEHARLEFGIHQTQLEDAQRTLDAARAEQSALAGNSAEQISELEHRLARETEAGREIGAQLARGAAEAIALRDELTRARGEAVELKLALERASGERGGMMEALGAERDMAQRDASQQRHHSERLASALREVRQALSDLPPSVQRVTLAAASPSSLEQPDAPSSDAPTQPGLPSYIEGLEGLEEQVTLRDERILELSDRLARARGRLSTTARMLRELCAEHDPVPATRVVELLAWLDGSD